MFRFENLEIWRKAILYAENVYLLIKKFPQEERYALCDQLRRSAVSVSANIAEGSGSSSSKDFMNFLNIALRSIFETVSLVAIAEKNRYITNKEFMDIHGQAELLSKQIHAFRNSLKNHMP